MAMKHKSSFSLYDDDDLEEEPIVKKPKEVAKSESTESTVTEEESPKPSEIVEFKRKFRVSESLSSASLQMNSSM